MGMIKKESSDFMLSVKKIPIALIKRVFLRDLICNYSMPIHKSILCNLFE